MTMSVEENKALVRRFYEEIDKGNSSVIDELVAEDYLDHSPPPFPGLSPGRQGVYDLPWNPQRIEQRIGRCHRYGQRYDVVVVNFLNKNNAADQRVYELLAEKFKLFSGVFGASDEVLGAIESGVEFEKRIVAIYQTCRGHPHPHLFLHGCRSLRRSTRSERRLSVRLRS
jgi:hypothetical protein